MALSSTVYVFDIRLADADRNIFETLSLRVARHPSESEAYLLTRVLAYCLEYTEGLTFSNGGLSDPDEPALAVRDLTGALQRWIEIGTPDAARLHKASKSAPRVVVYAHKDVEAWLARIAGERIHRADKIQVFAVDLEFLAALTIRLVRRMAFDLSVAEGTLYVSLGDETLTGAIVLRALGKST
ncbi:MAG TPA: YaeQ family protein [Steroidobacteraceae bacterium]|nr:YaeQ family protein [Steroidobacteraceae bacterium]